MFPGGFLGGDPGGSYQPGDPVAAPDTEGPVRLRLLGTGEGRVGANWPPLVFQVVHGPNNRPLPLPDPSFSGVELRRPNDVVLSGTPAYIDPVDARQRWPESGTGLSVFQLAPFDVGLTEGWVHEDRYHVSARFVYDGGKVILAPTSEVDRITYTVHPRHPTTAAA